MLYSFPPQAQYGKVIPKSKIYEHSDITSSLKQKFVSQIDKIIWSYKLAQETINLPPTPKVPEIEVLSIYLKGTAIDDAVLKAIDRAIPLPILFYIHTIDKKVQLVAAYKRPSEAATKRWVIEAYFKSDWFRSTSPPRPLPVALNLESLYIQIIKALMPQNLDTTQIQDIEAELQRAQQIAIKEKKYQQLLAKRDRQKQFNKRVQLNQELHKLKEEIEMLKYANKEEQNR